jgi:exopolyphosphatase/guanosine-5'-triphosphate,3'-diphosphate pyrophosphatase
MDGADRLAVIDLGSNTFRLVVFSYGASEAGNRYYYRSDEIYEPVRLAEGLGRTGRLGEPAIGRATSALSIFAHFLRASGIPQEAVVAVATEAVRRAANGGEFLALAKAQSGVGVRLLSGVEEAHYGYLAAANTTTITDGYLFELGGGSLQIVELVGRQPVRKLSLPLGTVTLTEQFCPGPGPVPPAALERLRTALRDRLHDALPWREAERLVGIGGAVRNLATALAPKGLPTTAQGLLIAREPLRKLTARLADLPAGQRARMPGIKTARADVIVAAAVLLEVLIELAGGQPLEATEAGLREGIFFERFFADGGGLVDDVRRFSVLNLAARYGLDGPHANHVAALALSLFDQAVALRLFTPLSNERELLWAAAILHDVGMAVDYDDHHRHSRYLILHQPLAGYSPWEVAAIAQLARYHRKGEPGAGPFRFLLGQEGEGLVRRGAALLRLAENLERARDQAVAAITLQPEGEGVRVVVEGEGELALQRWAAAREADLFQAAFGLRLVGVESRPAVGTAGGRAP